MSVFCAILECNAPPVPGSRAMSDMSHMRKSELATFAGLVCNLAVVLIFSISGPGFVPPGPEQDASLLAECPYCHRRDLFSRGGAPARAVRPSWLPHVYAKLGTRRSVFRKGVGIVSINVNGLGRVCARSAGCWPRATRIYTGSALRITRNSG